MAVTAPPTSPRDAATIDWPVPRAAYVHVPFCRHRCGYCNFSVIAGREDLGEAFLDALTQELRRLGSPQPVDTLFIGGGTPTHLPPAWLQRLLALTRAHFPLACGGEFAVEANPRDIEPAKLEVLQNAGVNRLSLGVQSFDAAKLQLLERDHSRQIAEAAIAEASEVIGNVSIDLIFAAPGETLAAWEQDLACALATPVRHVSTYALTFEKGTRFWNRLQRDQLQASAEATELAMYQAARSRLAAAGLEQYEISNFASPGYRCRHNLAYWEGRGWFAAGPGAARFCNGRRLVNHRSPTAYIKRCLAGQDPTAEDEPLDHRQWAAERAAFGVRMLAGIDLRSLHRETGYDIATACAEELQRLEQEGLLVREGTHIRLTERGILFADSIASVLLAA